MLVCMARAQIYLKWLKETPKPLYYSKRVLSETLEANGVSSLMRHICGLYEEHDMD